MFLKYLILFLLGILLFTQCKKDDSTPSNSTLEKLAACRDNPINDSLAIHDNLIGQWKIDGYGCGHCVPHNAPKASIILGDRDGVLVFQDDWEEEITLEFSWYLQKVEILSQNQEKMIEYQMITTPFHYSLQMDNYCKNYISFDHQGWDGHMFLYKKQ